MVQPYRNFSLNIVKGETSCAGCLSTSSEWFKHIEPHRTYANHNITELARCGEVCHRSSGWFDCTEPSLSLQQARNFSVCRVVVHLFGVVQAHRTSSKTNTNHFSTEIARCVEVYHRSSGWFDRPNLLYVHRYRGNKECRVQEVRVVRLYRTFSIYIVTGETRSAGCSCKSSG